MPVHIWFSSCMNYSHSTIIERNSQLPFCVLIIRLFAKKFDTMLKILSYVIKFCVLSLFQRILKVIFLFCSDESCLLTTFVDICRWSFLYIYGEWYYTYVYKRGFKCSTKRTAYLIGRLSFAFTGEVLSFVYICADWLVKFGKWR